MQQIFRIFIRFHAISSSEADIEAIGRGNKSGSNSISIADNYGGAFSRDWEVTAENAKQANSRIVAIVRQTAVGKVLGVASAEL